MDSGTLCVLRLRLTIRKGKKNWMKNEIFMNAQVVVTSQHAGYRVITREGQRKILTPGRVYAAENIPYSIDL